MSPRLWTRRRRRWWLFTAAVLVVAVGLGMRLVLAAAHPASAGALVSPGTATMFSPSLTSGVAREVASVEPQAQHLMAKWWRQHGTTPNDKGFATWLGDTVPGPPPKAERLREAHALTSLAGTRTPQGMADAQWLDAHGHDDVWKAMAQRLPSKTQGELDDLLDFSTQVGSDLQNQFAASSPYVLRPVLRAGQSVTASGNDCVCSYPSSHAANSAAARTFLAHFQTNPGDLIRWEAEVDYSRLYVAGHIPSDVRAGALLGDMIGQYFLVTRGHAPVPAVAG